MEKEEESAKIGVKKPTDDSLGSTTYQYGHVLNELFPKNATSDEVIKEPATQPVQEKQTDLTDIYELAEKDGIKIIKAKDTLYKLELDMNKTTMDELWGLFKADEIQDITISSTPLEEIIKEIYRGKDE